MYITTDKIRKAAEANGKAYREIRGKFQGLGRVLVAIEIDGRRFSEADYNGNRSAQFADAMAEAVK